MGAMQRYHDAQAEWRSAAKRVQDAARELRAELLAETPTTPAIVRNTDDERRDDGHEG